ncbi:coiled-coil domain-containing protein 43 [Stomoxys calcitrans]|uniref:coiled-coil domain-containing protein 43 n=1 Tax=Stomoxys calcitrans TaxID=35570 RepID=UPI0027E36168|nr:coiled-coil domain-containing protein 43 [Stomoxys calcitrans]
MAAAPTEFTKWLNQKLKELNTDETVFGSYITGILEDDDSLEEKKEALEGILSEILTDNIAEFIESILDKWQACTPKEDDANKSAKLNVDEQLAKLLESTKVQAVVKERQYTEEEKKIREQILAQYSQTEVSDEEYEPAQSDEEDNKHGGGGGGGGLTGIERNTNALDVQNLIKEKREQARLESAAKKQKDKEDREKQKQMREEKKEKRKTVKGERRR